MSAVIDFPTQAPALQPLAPAATSSAALAGVWRLRPRGLQMDFGTLMGKLERTMRWLDRHRIEVAAFSCSTLRGAKVVVRHCPRLRQLLADEMCSKGHKQFAGVRYEQWEARDSATGVLIVWEEERREGRP